MMKWFVHSVFAQSCWDKPCPSEWQHIIKLIIYESQEVRKYPFPANLTISRWTDCCSNVKTNTWVHVQLSARHKNLNLKTRSKWGEEQLNITEISHSEQRAVSGGSLQAGVKPRLHESPQLRRISSCLAEHPSASLGGCVWDGKGGGWTNPFPCHWAAW